MAYEFPFSAVGRDYQLKLSGIADRIDRLDSGSLRVVDYKTGSPHLDFKGLDALFHGEARDRQANTLQTLLYAMMLSRGRGCDVVPSLYYVRNMHREDYEPWLMDRELQRKGVPYSHYADEFERLLGDLLAELYDPDLPFTQAEDVNTCQYCDFKAICRR